jgi:hypothetical protein
MTFTCTNKSGHFAYTSPQPHLIGSLEYHGIDILVEVFQVGVFEGIDRGGGDENYFVLVGRLGVLVDANVVDNLDEGRSEGRDVVGSL